MDVTRSIKYYYLRIRRLRGSPQQLAMGIAVGVFVGSLPIIPFQTAVAVGLALCLGCSKLTAALGTWISNPLDWYFLYYYSYKIGAGIIGLPEHKALFTELLTSVQHGHSFFQVAEKILGMGGLVAFAFVLGGVLIGLALSPLAYLVFLVLFKRFQRKRYQRKAYAVVER